MNKTDIQDFRNGVRRLYRNISKLNLYVQNARKPDASRLATELKNLSSQLDELSINTPVNPIKTLPRTTTGKSMEPGKKCR